METELLMDEMLRLDNVQDYNRLLGVETLHPLVSVVDMSQLESIAHHRIQFGFYCIYFKQLDCGTVLYGRSKYDYQEGTMLFIAPGQTAGVADGGATLNPKGWILMFHPDLLYGTPLSRRMKDYSFFSYSSDEALHMSEREKHIILNCFGEIQEELDTEIEVGELVETVEYDYPGFHLTMHCFLCTISSGALVLKEHEAARWLTREELDDVDWLPADVKVVEKLRLLQV